MLIGVLFGVPSPMTAMSPDELPIPFSSFIVMIFAIKDAGGGCRLGWGVGSNVRAERAAAGVAGGGPLERGVSPHCWCCYSSLKTTGGVTRS